MTVGITYKCLPDRLDAFVREARHLQLTHPDAFYTYICHDSVRYILSQHTTAQACKTKHRSVRQHTWMSDRILSGCGVIFSLMYRTNYKPPNTVNGCDT